jgi:predicted phage-related endonuclease
VIRQTFLPENGLPWAHPTNRPTWMAMRASYITSTDVATLFDCNSYQSKSKLWYLKSNHLVDETPVNAAMQNGLDREDAVARAVAKAEGWTERPMLEFIALPEIGLASTFDREVWMGEAKYPFEIKCINAFVFCGPWRRQGRKITQTSARVRCQLETQRLVGGFTKSFLGVETSQGEKLAGEFNADPFVQQMILDRVGEFRKALKRDIPLPGIRVRKLVAVQ